MPAPALALSVFITIVVAAVIAVVANGLTLVNMGIIIGVNVGLLLLVDCLKMWFRQVIKDEPGDIIESDELIPVDVKKTDTEKTMEKNIRYAVHRASTVKDKDLQHRVQFVPRTGWKRFFTELRFTNISSGFVNQQRTVAHLGSQSMQYESMSYRE